MPPRGKKTKAEEALAFLENLDSLDAPSEPSTGETASLPPSQPAIPSATSSTPRASTDSGRKDLPAELKADPISAEGEQDEEAAKALAYLEAQINTKRAPLTVPQPGSRTASPAPAAASTSGATPLLDGAASGDPANVPTSSSPPASGGWGVSSFWSSATSAIQSAQKIADEGYKRVRTEGVQGVTGQLEQLGVKGVDLNQLRKGAEERLGGLGGMVKGVDLEKLRHDLLSNASTTLTSILNTVAPPISAHETLELWLSHPLTGYGGVEGAIYRAWTKILEQTESGELIIVWSPPEGAKEVEPSARSMNHADGWDEGWKAAEKEMEDIKGREEKDPRGRGKSNATVPVTTVPIFLHLQPILAPLPFPEPSILLSRASSSTPPQHLYFLMMLQDPSHSLRFTTVSQPSPADWLEVEYEKSDWVEERLVEVLRTGVEVVAQDYVATRMGLKPSTVPTRPASPKLEPADEPDAEAPKAD